MLWCERSERVLRTDILGSTLHAHPPASGKTKKWAIPQPLASFALTANDDRLLLGLASQLAFYDFSSGAITPVRAIEPALPARLNAQWGAARVVRSAPDGTIDRIIESPTLQPSCVTLGGPALNMLYVSSVRWPGRAGGRWRAISASLDRRLRGCGIALSGVGRDLSVVATQRRNNVSPSFPVNVINTTGQGGVLHGVSRCF